MKRTLKLNKTFYEVGITRLGICEAVLHELFDVPFGTPEIDVHITKRPTKDSYECIFNGRAVVVEYSDGKCGLYVTTHATDIFLEEHVGSDVPFYVSVKY